MFLIKGLSSWREAVQRSVTSSQLSMALYTLEQCVAWDKSIMKAVRKREKSISQRHKLIHTFLFRYRIVNFVNRESRKTNCFSVIVVIVDIILTASNPNSRKFLKAIGNFILINLRNLKLISSHSRFCFECINKVTGERKCIICGNLRPAPLGKLVLCELCPRAYHHDCYIPPMLKVPRGKWYCANCIGKAPPKKKPVRKPKELKSHNSSQSLDSSHDEVAPNR